MRDFTTNTPLPSKARGETLTPNPSPRTGEGRNPHPQPLSQGARGGKGMSGWQEGAQHLPGYVDFPYFRKKDKMIIITKNVPASVPMRLRSLMTSE